MHTRVFVDGTPENLCRCDELLQVLGSHVRVVCSGPLLAGVTRSCVDLRLGYTLSLMPRVDRMPQCVGRTDCLQLRSPLLITKLHARRQPYLPTVIIHGLLGEAEIRSASMRVQQHAPEGVPDLVGRPLVELWGASSTGTLRRGDTVSDHLPLHTL